MKIKSAEWKGSENLLEGLRKNKKKKKEKNKKKVD